MTCPRSQEDLALYQCVLMRRDNTGIFYCLRSNFITIVSGTGKAFHLEIKKWNFRGEEELAPADEHQGSPRTQGVGSACHTLGTSRSG